MAETITPVVHGGSRRAWAVLLAVHVLGAAIAAAAFGAALGAFGALLGAPWGTAGTLAVAAAAAVYLIAELGARVPVPQLRETVRMFCEPEAAMVQSCWVWSRRAGCRPSSPTRSPRSCRASSRADWVM